MAAIRVENYQNIVNYYGQAQLQVANLASYYYNAAVEIVSLADFDVELACLSPFYSAYLATSTIYSTPPQAAIAAVKALQDHVLDKARTDDALTTTNLAFTDINDWIDAAGTNGVGTNVGREGDTGVSIHVNNEFATMSGLAGHAIEADNIEG